MTSSVNVMDGLHRARQRVVAERQRATRAAAVAARHELAAAKAPPPLKEIHEKVAAAHRRMEARHLVTAGVQAEHVARLRSWAQATLRRPDGSIAAGTAQSGADHAGTAPGSLAPTHDMLTGLPNRTLFIELLGKAMGWFEDLDPPPQSPLRIGMLVIDLDNFKAVCDRLGHGVGDQLLTAIARRLTDRTRGRVLARLGGDEFAVLLEDTYGTDEATQLAELVEAAICEPVSVDGHDLTISASIGVVERPVAGADPIEIMRAADIALNFAKSAGRGRWAQYDSRWDAEATARYALAAALPAAIDRAELFLLYQPIMDLRAGRVVAAEALVRWRHPEQGLLRPGQFIDIAEESGQIVRLGKFVLNEACREAARWSDLTADPPVVSVNVTARQLRDTDLVAEVASALDRAGLPPSRLQLEIIEGAIVRPDDQSVSVLRRLVELGVRIAIDDFGTGYSNMSYLRRLPVQVLKIDQSFVAEIGHPEQDSDSTDVQIMAAMISLGHVLGLTVTAEGVETREQAEVLASIGCDQAQGWRFGRPTDDLTATLANQRPRVLQPDVSFYRGLSRSR